MPKRKINCYNCAKRIENKSKIQMVHDYTFCCTCYLDLIRIITSEKKNTNVNENSGKEMRNNNCFDHKNSEENSVTCQEVLVLNHENVTVHWGIKYFSRRNWTFTWKKF